jgi:hypothetical protein
MLLSEAHMSECLVLGELSDLRLESKRDDPGVVARPPDRGEDGGLLDGGGQLPPRETGEELTCGEETV